MKVYTTVLWLILFVAFVNEASGATYDLTGDWTCTFTNGWASGDVGCGLGPNPSSDCSITQVGESFTLTIYTLCDPAFTCIFSGVIQGNVYSGSNSGPLDGGGTVTNSINFVASSTAASGAGTSIASFPDWHCNWGFNSFLLTERSSTGRFHLTTTVMGSGNILLSPPGELYLPGSVVNLTATPDQGWRFISWSGNLTETQNPQELSMNSDKSVTATFVAKSELLTLVIKTLKILSGDITTCVECVALDVDGNGTVGLAEVITLLKLNANI